MSISKRRLSQSGFTIIELMIASLVFAVVLLVVTYGILQITRVYYKGVTETNTQNSARGIIDSISQAVQFSGVVTIQQTAGTTPGSTFAFCVGNQRYTYILGYQVMDSLTPGKSQAYHGLTQDTYSSCASTPPIAGNFRTTPNIPSSREFLSKRMRLAKLAVKPVTGTTNVWRVTVKVVYGDDDLLVGTGAPTGPDVTCKSGVQGTQFCAISELSTVVVKRVQ